MSSTEQVFQIVPQAFSPVVKSEPVVRIVSLDERRHAEWDRFVEAHRHGSPFHLMAWQRTIEQTYRFRPMHLMALRGENICGVLPLFLVKNFLMGKVLLSTPFAVYGGPLVADGDVLCAFRETLRRLGQNLKVDYVELRNAYPEQGLGFSRLDRYVTFTQEIGSNEEEILAAIPRKTRAMVRKSLKLSFSTREQAHDFLMFEDLYTRNLRRLGTPRFARKHFANLIKNFGDSVNVREMILDGKVVAAVMSFYFRDQILPYYGASDPNANPHAANNFMYYDLMCWGSRHGYTRFDFGRSKRATGGSYDFKSHWGMTERELPYELMMVRRKDLPNYSPKNPKFDLPIRIWKRMPLFLTRLIGPMLVRLVP